MSIPGFVADATFTLPMGQYPAESQDRPTRGYVIPAIPTTKNCNYACNSCQNCLDNTGSATRCATQCRVCDKCKETGDGRPSGMNTSPSPFQWSFCTWVCTPNKGCGWKCPA